MLSSIGNYLKEHKWIPVVILLLIGYCIFKFTNGNPKDTIPKSEQQTIIKSTTSLEVQPKTSPNDNDLEVTQRYRANINGSQVDIPVTTKENTKGVLKQEIDMTPVLKLQQQADEKAFRKHWEVGTGIGYTDGDTYIPIEIQRNYKADKAVSIEIHLDVKGNLKGGELKHKWMF